MAASHGAADQLQLQYVSEQYQWWKELRDTLIDVLVSLPAIFVPLFLLGLLLFLVRGG